MRTTSRDSRQSTRAPGTYRFELSDGAWLQSQPCSAKRPSPLRPVPPRSPLGGTAGAPRDPAAPLGAPYDLVTSRAGRRSQPRPAGHAQLAPAGPGSLLKHVGVHLGAATDWINLHAVGVDGDTLVVEVECQMGDEASRPPERIAVNLSGPERAFSLA